MGSCRDLAEALQSASPVGPGCWPSASAVYQLLSGTSGDTGLAKASTHLIAQSQTREFTCAPLRICPGPSLCSLLAGVLAVLGSCPQHLDHARHRAAWARSGCSGPNRCMEGPSALIIQRRSGGFRAHVCRLQWDRMSNMDKTMQGLQMGCSSKQQLFILLPESGPAQQTLKLKKACFCRDRVPCMNCPASPSRSVC